MNRQAVSTEHAPAALGPYSQAIVANGFVFCSGTAGIDPESGSIPEGIEAQTEQALRNLAAILNAAGASMTDLVKTTIFYSDVADFASLNEVYARHMPDPPPARSAPANVRLPRGLLVSIEGHRRPPELTGPAPVGNGGNSHGRSCCLSVWYSHSSKRFLAQRRSITSRW